MALTNCNFKIAYNNLLTDANCTVSSELTDFEFSQALDNNRSTKWYVTGTFDITTANNKLYINDGADRTITVTAGTYTRASLATEIMTKLNASSSAWVVVDNQTGVKKFGISHTGAATLRFSVQTDAIWDMIGFTSQIDSTNTVWVASEIRVHTSEHVTVDLGEDHAVGFFGLIGPIDETFILSPTATVTIKGNNVNDFAAPLLSYTATPEDGGCFGVWDEVTCRYWKIEIIDRDNDAGPSFYFTNIFLGSYLHFDNRNIQSGFAESVNDNSTSFQAQSGYLFFSEFPQNTNLSAINIRMLDSEQKKEMRDFFRTVGIVEPFFFVADPGVNVSESLGELTFFCRNASGISFQHIKSDRFDCALALAEVI